MPAKPVLDLIGERASGSYFIPLSILDSRLHGNDGSGFVLRRHAKYNFLLVLRNNSNPILDKWDILQSAVFDF